MDGIIGTVAHGNVRVHEDAGQAANFSAQEYLFPNAAARRPPHLCCFACGFQQPQSACTLHRSSSTINNSAVTPVSFIAPAGRRRQG
ncbi:hypothetical protein GUJ93_ZPchr0003g16860 [Zizania palustris]|uniref:Uncharacterized protein n=1 Tax=Zizania palustris TaxID=103762 RepID=A0A8J5SU71_ZIZPA|nr:hypothetical protein GUJ93_ZPchr0003g16860 [Zizania palustris]